MSRFKSPRTRQGPLRMTLARWSTQHGQYAPTKGVDGERMDRWGVDFILRTTIRDFWIIVHLDQPLNSSTNCSMEGGMSRRLTDGPLVEASSVSA